MMKPPDAPCADGEHEPAVDHFAKLPGIHRTVPGDVWCRRCHASMPYYWRRGELIPADSAGAPQS